MLGKYSKSSNLLGNRGVFLESQKYGFQTPKKNQVKSFNSQFFSKWYSNSFFQNYDKFVSSVIWKLYWYICKIFMSLYLLIPENSLCDEACTQFLLSPLISFALQDDGTNSADSTEQQRYEMSFSNTYATFDSVEKERCTSGGQSPQRQKESCSFFGFERNNPF